MKIIEEIEVDYSQTNIGSSRFIKGREIHIKLIFKITNISFIFLIMTKPDKRSESKLSLEKKHE